MFYRPLLLVSIVIAALCCGAQTSPFNNEFGVTVFRSHLTGVVHDNNDRPVNGARVDLMDVNTGHPVPGTYTFANGTFQFENLRNGTYELIVSSGAAQQRTQVDVDSDRDVSVRLPVNPVPEGNNATVSLSQMKVPGKAQSLLHKAEEAFRKSRIDDAFRFVQKALGVYPDYAKALTLRGILNMQKGDNTDAQPDLERAVQLDYGDGIGFVALASLYNNEGKFDRAQQTLKHGMSMNAKSWQADMEMARAQIGQKDYAAAVRSLDRAMPQAPPTATVMHLFRAQALIGMNAYGDAMSELKSYLEKSPEGPNSDQARKTLAQLQRFTETAKK